MYAHSLRHARAHYRGLRAKVLDLAGAGRSDEAHRPCETQLFRAFMRCKQLSDPLLKYNVRRSEQLGNSINPMCDATHLLLVVLATALFVVGFALEFPR